MKKRPAQESGDSYAGRFPSAWLEILHFVSDRKTPKMPENTVLFIGNAFHDLRGALQPPAKGKAAAALFSYALCFAPSHGVSLAELRT